MRSVTAQEFDRWLASGRVLEADARGPKVVALENGHFLKIFHTRRTLLLARLQPAATRFSRNADLLHELGVPAPTVIERFWINRHQALSGCIYVPLPGVSIDKLYINSPAQLETILPNLAAFIRSLHTKKLYFRSLHIGNIMLLPDSQFGLIDFLDLKRNFLPLSQWQINRNFRHLSNHLSRRNLANFPQDRLLQLYRHEGMSRETIQAKDGN